MCICDRHAVRKANFGLAEERPWLHCLKVWTRLVWTLETGFDLAMAIRILGEGLILSIGEPLWPDNVWIATVNTCKPRLPPAEG